MASLQTAAPGLGSAPSPAADLDHRSEINEQHESSASAIPSATRRGIEQTFGVDLSGTRIHTDTAAADQADALSAHAFTVGQDVYFGAGTFAPGTREGDRLLAHELAHVAQGSAGPQCKAVSSEPGDAAEIEADHAADLAVQNIYDGGQNRVQLSATPTATHMRKAQKPSIAGEASRRESIVLSVKTPARPGHSSAFYQLMSAMGQQSEIDTLDREYMVFAGLLPLLQLSMDRVGTLERETGLSASSPSLVVAYFENLAKKGESSGNIAQEVKSLTQGTDSVKKAMVSGSGGLQSAIHGVQVAQLELEVALNEAKIDAISEEKQSKEGEATAIQDRYQLVVDSLAGATKLIFAAVTFDAGAITGLGSALTADGSPLTELAGAGAEAASGNRLAMLDPQWQSLQRTIAALEGKLASAKRENINNKIKIANTNLKSAWETLRGRQNDILQSQLQRRNEYAAIGQAGDKAKVGGGAETNKNAAEGHGEQIMLLVAGIRERGLMIREFKGFLSSAGSLTDTAAQKKQVKEYDAACRAAGPHNQGYLWRSGMGYVKDDGSVWEHDNCTKYVDIYMDVLDKYYGEWTTQEAEWLKALSILTSRKALLDY